MNKFILCIDETARSAPVENYLFMVVVILKECYLTSWKFVLNEEVIFQAEFLSVIWILNI